MRTFTFHCIIFTNGLVFGILVMGITVYAELELTDKLYKHKVNEGRVETKGEEVVVWSTPSSRRIIAEYIKDCLALCVTSDSSFKPCMDPEALENKIETLRRSHYETSFYMCVKQSDAWVGSFISQFREKKLNKETLKESKFLTNLILYKLGIHDLGDYIVKGMNFLRELRIEYNAFSVLRKRVFDGGNKLKKLSLQGNGIATIERNAFRDLVYLELLDLSHNELIVLYWALFSDVKNLRDLLLNNNHLTKIALDIPPGWIPGATELMVFQDEMVELKRLDLQCNELQTIDPLLLLRVPHVEKLNIANNMIKRLGNPFEVLDELRVLNLSYNALRIPQPSWYFTLKPGENGEPVDLSLFGNEWRCDCDIFEYHFFLNAKRIKLYADLGEEKGKAALKELQITCFFPTELSGSLLSELPIKSILKMYQDCSIRVEYETQNSNLNYYLFTFLSIPLFLMMIRHVRSKAESNKQSKTSKPKVATLATAKNINKYNVGLALHMCERISPILVENPKPAPRQ